MENQIYRIRMESILSGTCDLEFSIFETNECEPYKETRELGIQLVISGN